MSEPSEHVEWVWRSIGTAETVVPGFAQGPWLGWTDGSGGLSCPPFVRSLLALTVAVVMVLPAAPASADAVDSAVASKRGSGLPVRAELEQTAINSASRQATNLELSHISLSPLTSICSSAGEIVGAGRSVGAVFDLFMQSSHHRTLLMSSSWTAMGTGAVTGSDGKIYISVVFCTETSPSSGSTAPPPPPAPTTSTKLQPVAPSVATPPPAPAHPGFDVVLVQLLGGELDDLWWAAFGDAVLPQLGPAPFLPLASWIVPNTPALV